MLWLCVAKPFFIFPRLFPGATPKSRGRNFATANMYLLSNLIDSFDFDDTQV